jgi:predicted metalloprotease with PDZ domain
VIGDELLAVDGWRLRRLEDARGWTRPGQALELTLVRDQRLRTLTVTPTATPPAAVQLQLDAKPAAAAEALRREWLGV